VGRFQSRKLGPFGGLNQNENPHAIPPNDLVEARNVVHRGDTLGTRPGLILEATGKQYAVATTGANPIQGLHEHRENIDAGRHLLAVGDDGGGGSVESVFHEDGDALPKLATITGGKDNVWTFASHNNKTYAAGGANADHFWYFDGDTGTGATQINALDSGANTLLPNYVFPWRNYLFLGGFNPATPTSDNNASTVRFADFASDPTVAANWKVGNTIGFTAYGKSHNTGVSSYRDNSGDYLMLLYNDHIQTVNLDPTSGFSVPFFVSDKISNGCVNQRAYVDLGLDAGDSIYMSERGFHSLRQSQEHGNKADKFLSWKIRPFMKTLNRDRMKYSVGAYDFQNGYVLFAVSTGSNTTHDAILCLDVKQDEPITAKNARWSIWYIGGSKSINELKYLRDEDNVWRMYYGTTTGEVGYFDDNTFADFGSSYQSKFQTAHDASGGASFNKNLGDVTVTIGPSGTYTPTMKFHFDYGRKISEKRLIEMPPSSGAVWGTAQWDSGEWGADVDLWDQKIYGSGSGSTVGFSVEHSTAGQPFFVSSIDFQLRIVGEDSGDVSSGA